MIDLRKCSALLACALMAAALHAQAPAAPPATTPAVPAESAGDHVMAPMPKQLPLIYHYQALNPGETFFNGADQLAEPRLIAAGVIATDYPNPKMIVDVGSFSGEFLEALLDKFPGARGQWTEPVDGNKLNAQRRFARFGDRIDYVIGCPSRDISLGCVPKNVDVLISSWITHHQDPAGVAKFYKLAYGLLPSNGWLAVLDHVAATDANWQKRLDQSRLGFQTVVQGPPQHGKHATASLEEQLADVKAAGFDDYQLVWKSFNTVLIMAHKK